MTDVAKITDQLRAAVEAVTNAGVPEDLREIAFERTLESLLGSGAARNGGSPPVDEVGGGQGGVSPERGPATSSAIARLASELNIDPKVAATVCDIDEEGLHITLAPSRFTDGVGKAMEDIARLVVAGRQAAGIDDEWTSIEVVREACKDRGHYSGGNFAKYTSRLDGDGFRIRGGVRAREFKVNALGKEQTGHLIMRLVNE